MKKLNLNSIRPFWQEIIFIIIFGFLLSGMVLNASVSFQYTKNIVFFCIFLFMFICLIGQFYLKSFALGLWLSVLLVISFLLMFFVFFAILIKLPEGNTKDYIILISGLFLFFGLMITAFTMPFKYLYDNNFMPKISEAKT